MTIRRRDFLSTIGAGIATMQVPVLGQRGRPLAPGEVREPARGPAPPPPVRKATVTKLFRTPDGIDAKSGATVEIIQLAAGDPDPHGLAILDGKLYFCDAGIHPGWQRDKSPHTGWVCRVDVV
jgi:hypothetical protein